MYLLWIGLAFVLLKLFEIGPIGQWPWWWALIPLAAAALWFEVFEKMLGFDRRALEQDEVERQRRARVAQQFGEKPRR